ncbi:hypothetical protein Taro_029703 [Colocasia esculenta]|uniref:STAS domain-containing protein n=1 Tax=Colocasia esculenta TaxID=4460 RepID=A0A843VY01_COLES|nr:hypothetical protein [Colocasia esculenta]
MAASGLVFPGTASGSVEYCPPCTHQVPLPPARPFLQTLRANVKETFFPDDPFRHFRGRSASRRFLLALQYVLPVLQWAPTYSLGFLKADLLAGVTIASLAIPQGISYAKLAGLPPILGLYSSFVPPLVYAVLGSSRDLAVGTVAVGSLLMGSMLGKAVSPLHDPVLYLHLAFTTTFFAGVLQASLGILRLGFVVDFLSHATIVGFMGGSATVVCLQQLKGILGLHHFTTDTDLVSVMKSVFSQTHQWRWESVVLGVGFLIFLLFTRFLSKRRPKFFWISAMAPLTCIILGSLLAYSTHAENHGVDVVSPPIGKLKKGLNPPSSSSLEGTAVARSFATLKNYHIDGNKEMVAFGMMNIAGSLTSCYLTAGPFSRTAVNYNAGCKTAVSNMVMAVAVMFTLLFLTPLFHYTPLVVLSSIIISAMIGLIDYAAAIHLWKVDKLDFCVCMGAYLGVVFVNVETGLLISVGVSILRVLLFVGRPRTVVLGNIPNSTIYRRMDHYSDAQPISGVLILRVEAPIYFANTSYLRERLFRWMDEMEEEPSSKDRKSLQYVILDMGAVGGIDTSGISMLEELKKTTERKGIQLLLANPGSEVMKKLSQAKVMESIGWQWIFLTVDEAVTACNFALHVVCKAPTPDIAGKITSGHSNV